MNKKKWFYNEFNIISEELRKEKLYFTLQKIEYNDYSGNIKISLYTPWDKQKELLIIEKHFYSKKEQNNELFNACLSNFTEWLKLNKEKIVNKNTEYLFKNELLQAYNKTYLKNPFLLNGRLVFNIYFSNIGKKIKCSDCKDSANQLIIETNGDSWFYCGLCNIGG